MRYLRNIFMFYAFTQYIFGAFRISCTCVSLQFIL